MLQATIATVAGLALWYAVKLLVSFRKVRTRQLLQLLPVAVALTLALVVWESDGCAPNIREKSSAVLVIAACAALLDVVIQLQRNRQARYMPPPNAAVGVALVYLYSACVREPAQTACTVGTALAAATSTCLLIAGAA